MKKLILLELALLFLATTFQSDNPPGWYQQTLPVSDNINDIFFLDSLNGWAVTPNGHILNTQNGGDNWSIQKDSAGNLFTVQFLDVETGYASGRNNHGIIYKTTNSGVNWNLIFDFSPVGNIDNMSFVNNDTGWACSKDPFDGGVFKTTNGGLSWQQQLNLGIGNPLKIFFINKDTGWFANDFEQLYKTINGGVNWNGQYTFNNNSIFKDLFFVNGDTGWVCESNQNIVQFTSNGGNNWISQNLPAKDSIILTSRPKQIFSVDGRVVYGVGGNAFFGMGRVRGIIYKSTNSGENWIYQLPDTSINIATYTGIQFVNDSIGWASYTGMIHTKNGGGPLVKVGDINYEIPESFLLYQNYPNPFNPKTIIGYRLKIAGNVELEVFNIQGKEIVTLINQKQNEGEYKIEFNGNYLPSGIYFYKLSVSDEMSNQLYSKTRRMILTK